MNATDAGNSNSNSTTIFNSPVIGISDANIACDAKNSCRNRVHISASGYIYTVPYTSQYGVTIPRSMANILFTVKIPDTSKKNNIGGNIHKQSGTIKERDVVIAKDVYTLHSATSSCCDEKRIATATMTMSVEKAAIASS